MKKIILIFCLITICQSTAKELTTLNDEHFKISGYDIKLYTLTDGGPVWEVLEIYKDGTLVKKHDEKMRIDIEYLEDLNSNGYPNMLAEVYDSGTMCNWNGILIYEFRPQKIKEVSLRGCIVVDDLFYNNSNQLMIKELEYWQYWENHCGACSPATEIYFILDKNLKINIAKDFMISQSWIEEIDTTIKEDCEAAKVEYEKNDSEDFVSGTFWSSMLKYYFAGQEAKAKEFYDSCFLWDENKNDEYFNTFLEKLESSSNWQLFKNYP